jgi:hypothetical protein
MNGWYWTDDPAVLDAQGIYDIAALHGPFKTEQDVFHAARLNTLISGPGDFDTKRRQQLALNALCTNQQINQINTFIRTRGSTAGSVAIFFRGQILEFMRWAARHCTNHRGDGETFNDPVQREKFLKALLISSV